MSYICFHCARHVGASIDHIPLKAWLPENIVQQVQGSPCVLLHLSEFQSLGVLSVALYGLLTAFDPIFLTGYLPSKWRETMSHEMESPIALAGANADEREQTFSLLLMNLHIRSAGHEF